VAGRAGWRIELEALVAGGGVEGLLGVGEELVGVGVGVEVDLDFGVGDGVVDAVREGVAEGLEEVEGAFVAGGIAVVADDGIHGAMGAEGGDGDEVPEAGSELMGAVAEDYVVDGGGVEVAAGVAGVGEGGVGEGGLGDVVAGEGVVGALEDGDGWVVVVGEVADDFAVAATAVVGVAEVVEGGERGWAVGVGGAVDVDVHAAGEEGEVVRGRVVRGVLRARREFGWWRGGALGLEGWREEEGGESEGGEWGWHGLGCGWRGAMLVLPAIM